MKPVGLLAMKDYPVLCSPELVRLLSILNEDEGCARMVGGAVRDALMGRKIGDVDLASNLPPEESMARLVRAGVKVIPTGLKHGTITAVINKIPFEITTLRRDVASDGRHATVAYIDDWTEDARRRDFTFNALYLDGEGNIYDPCQGLADLKARYVRFIGEADQRITEDALRILRFFRFAAQIGDGTMDPVGLDACVRHKALMVRLSGERLAQEIFRILAADNLLSILQVMADHGILAKVLPGHCTLDKLENFVALEQHLSRCDVLARLSCLLPDSEEAVRKVCRHLKLSNQQRKTLLFNSSIDFAIKPDMGPGAIRHKIYQYGRERVIFALMQSWSRMRDQDEAYHSLLGCAESWTIPVFPVKGADLMKRGYRADAKLGQELKRLDQLWLDSDFTLSKEDLLAL